MAWLNSYGDQEYELAASVPALNDAFGPIGFNQNKVLCGAIGEDTTVVDSGAVFVFSRDNKCDLTWVLDQGPIKASDPANNGFGRTGGIYNDLFAVGAEDADGKGAIYVFRNESGTWTQKAKLQPLDLSSGDKFGSDVKIYDKTIVVGASGQGTGAVYVFTTSDLGITWVQEEKLIPSLGDTGDQFGITVSLYADCLAVGANLDAGPTNTNVGAGAVYIYNRAGTTWTEEPIIRASDFSTGSEFGIALSMDNGGLAIGAHLESSIASQAGATYIFRLQAGSWVQEDKLTAFDGAVDDFFGRAIALQGSDLLIGAFGRDDFQVGSGTVYVFSQRSGTWEFQSRMEYRAPTGPDRMGLQIFLHENDGTAVVGLDGKNGNQGAALVYKPLKSQLFYGSTLAARDVQGVHTDIEGNLAVTSGSLPGITLTAGKAITMKFNPTTEKWDETQILIGSDSIAGDAFGRSVSLDGNQIAISARDRPDGANIRVGALYVFETADGGDSWTEVAGPLVHPSPAASDRLGNQVTIQGNTLVAGKFTHNGSEGGVHVWKKISGVWTHSQAIASPAGPSVLAQFGAFVHLQGNVLAISAAREDDNKGVIYIFKRPDINSPFVQKLRIFQQSEPQVAGLIWGIPFRMIGDTLAAGGRGNPGSVFIFRTTDNWETFFEEAKIFPPTLGSGDAFGTNIILNRTNNNVLVVAAAGDDDFDNTVSAVGIAYVYTRVNSTWVLRRQFRSPNRNVFDQLSADFGAMHGSTVMLSSIFDDGPFDLFQSWSGMTLIVDLGDPIDFCTIDAQDILSQIFDISINTKNIFKHSFLTSIRALDPSLHKFNVRPNRLRTRFLKRPDRKVVDTRPQKRITFQFLNKNPRKR